MLKTLLLAVSLIIATAISAQNFAIQTADTTLYGSASQSDFYGDIDLVNNTSSPLSMRWVRSEVNVPQSWESSVCTPSTCYPKTTDSSDYTMGVNNSNNYINVHFYPNGQEGTGYIKVKVFELSNPEDSYTMKFNGTTNPLEVKQHQTELISFFPNPVANELMVTSIPESMNGTTLTVYNFIGKQVKTEKLMGNTFSLNMQDLPVGNYLIKIKAGEHEIIKKIVKN